MYNNNNNNNNNNNANNIIKQINSSSTNTTINSLATPSSTNMSIPSITLSKNNLNHMNGINESNLYVKPSTSLHVIHSEEDFVDNKLSNIQANIPIQANSNNLAVKTPVTTHING